MSININKRLTPVIIVVLLFFSLFRVAEGDERYHKRNDKHFLWAVETGKNTIYIVGSIHVLTQESYPLAKEIEDIYNCCKKIIFETDLEGMNDLASQNKMIKLGLYQGGQTLSKNISQETFNLLRKRGFRVERFENFKPWFVALTITAMEIQRLGFDPDAGIDRHFFNKAKRDSKEMIFLETNDFQLNLMANLNKRQQESFLKETLKELEVIETMASDMVNAWERGNVEKLHSIIKIGFDEHPDIYNRFFIQRNKRWVSQIERMAQQDDVLVVVGAGHLVGKESVIELLKKKGYKVKQR